MKTSNGPALGKYFLAPILGLFLLGTNPNAIAQGVVTDNFDDGNLDGWEVRNVLQPLGGFVSDSFVANGDGLALRVERGSADMSAFGLPQDYGTARCWFFRTNQYEEFYVAMDIVDWNDSTNQAIVLLARASGFNETAGPGFPPGLGTTDGYVCNYDNLQDGDGTGDRLGGQFQINFVQDEAPQTLAAAEVTLTKGRSYRMIFKGTGPLLTAQLYDLEDLTAPIVTIHVDESGVAGYTSGASGIVAYHRNTGTHPNRSDMTVDNYYSGPADPDADIAPAIRHPIPGTPQVVSRTPTERFTNFHPADSGISFVAETFTANEINAAATKLYLNGVDVSASLAPLPANGSTVSFTTAAGTLAPNTVYAARIELEDTSGQLKSVNTFWFDTFSDDALANLKTVEVEDYNYSNGNYQFEPIPVSGLDPDGIQVEGNGVGYYGAPGTPDVDYHKPAGHYSASLAEYRSLDRVQITQGSYLSFDADEAVDIIDAMHFTPPVRIHSTQRSQYIAANVWEYQVRLTNPGDWMNYTRSFEEGNYHVYLRCATFGPTSVLLDRVTGDPSVPEQSTEPLGTFQVPNHLMRLNYTYEQLMDGDAPAVVSLSGLTTLRLTMGGNEPKENRLIVMDYLLFVPVAAAGPELSIERSGDSVIVSWPAPSIGFRLETASGLVSPAWTNVDSGITEMDGRMVYTAPIDTEEYYRLVSP